MIVFKLLKLQKLNIDLPKSIVEHCKQKYKGEMLTESLFAYQSLVRLYNEKVKKPFPEITFLDNGKPISDKISVTLSHSSGVVMVGFSTNPNDKIAVDVELIKDKKIEVQKRLGLNEDCTREEFYLAWTKKETLKKALNVSLLSGDLSEFKGESKVVKLDGKNYAVSIYSEGDYESNI